MADILSQTIDFDDKHTINVSDNDDKSLRIHIDNESKIPVSITGNTNTTLTDESVINTISELTKILELSKISELTKISEPVEIRNASTDLDMLKDVALQLYTYADFEKIKNRVDYGVLCFDRAYDYVRAFHIFLDRSSNKHFTFKIYNAKPETTANAAGQTIETYTEIRANVEIKISYKFYKKNILNESVKCTKIEMFKTFTNESNEIECKLSNNSAANIIYTVSCDGFKDFKGSIPDNSLDSVFEIYLEEKTDN